MSRIIIKKYKVKLIVLIGFAIIGIVALSGCTDNKKMYLPEAENDKIFTVIGK